MSENRKEEIIEALYKFSEIYFYDRQNPLTKQITMDIDINHTVVDLSVDDDFKDLLMQHFSIEKLPCIVKMPSRTVIYDKNKETDFDYCSILLKDKLKSDKITIFIKGTPLEPACGFTKQLIDILDENNLNYDFVNVFENTKIREGMKKLNDWPTFPMIYFGEEFIGGLDILLEMKDDQSLYAQVFKYKLK